MSTRQKTLVALLLLLTVFAVTHFAVFPGSLAHLRQVIHGQQILDLQPAFTANGVYQRLEDFGADGRAAYLQMIATIDFVFPLSAFAFLFLLGRLASEQTTGRLYVQYYWVLAALFLAADFLENLSIASLILHYPEPLNGIAGVLGYLSLTKRSSMLLALLIPLVILLYQRLARWHGR